VFTALITLVIAVNADATVPPFCAVNSPVADAAMW
jgi:hypothetical protein